MGVQCTPSDRDRLRLLLGVVVEPARAAALPTDDPALLAVARRHRLTPLLSKVCGQGLPIPLAVEFRGDRVVTTARNMALGQVAEECIRAFDAVGIRSIVLKGLAYEAGLYAAPGVRPTADVDLLVPNEMRRPAFATLDRLGFQPRAAAPGFDEPDYHEVAWTRNGVEVDLHMALAPLVRCGIDYAAIWSSAEPVRIGQTDTLALSRPHAAVFQALHMAIDHFAVPAIYLVDFARLIGNPRDAERAEQTARAWRCGKPFSTSAALVRAFLGVPTTSAADLSLPVAWFARSVVTRYGLDDHLPRRTQLVRKVVHFDAGTDLFRYVVTQGRRNLRELVERRVRQRSARARLALGE